ncbi:MAG TPA: hypothetical protein VJV78_21715, partial [Polyangiales bacterium]|nr:hypothetical protein [Polyangiales bacterium]
MTQLDPESRRILSLARSARTPTPEDQARVARRLAAAAGMASATTALTGTAQAKATILATPLKLWFTGSLLLTAAISGAYLSRPTSAPPPPKQPLSISHVPEPVPALTPA